MRIFLLIIVIFWSLGKSETIPKSCLPSVGISMTQCENLLNSWLIGSCQVHNVHNLTNPIVWLPSNCPRRNLGLCKVYNSCKQAPCKKNCEKLAGCVWLKRACRVRVSFDGVIDDTTSPTTSPQSHTPSPFHMFTRIPTLSKSPSELPTDIPSTSPTFPTFQPSRNPTKLPTTKMPTTKNPTSSTPTKSPITKVPSSSPTQLPTKLTTGPTPQPTSLPTTKLPTRLPTSAEPTNSPTQEASRIPTTKTNFLLLLADDLGYGDVGFHGGIELTNNLREISESPNGIKFTNFHSGSSVCSPSRAALLSGQYPDRNCVSGANTYNQWPARGMPSIARDVKAAGYSTAYFGKVHLGSFAENHPGVHGFDYWIGSETNIPTYDPSCYCNTPAVCGVMIAPCTNPFCFNASNKCQTQQPVCSTGAYPANFFQPQMWCGMKSGTSKFTSPGYTDFSERQMTSAYMTSKFEDYLKNLRVDVPFLAEIAFYEVHYPYIADPEQRIRCESGEIPCVRPGVKLTSNSAQSNYVNAIESMDKTIGRIREILRTYGRDHNTFLLFTSDNGPESKDAGGSGSAAPLSGMKRSLFEGGHRVPAVLEYPKLIQNNLQIDNLVSMIDIRPTVHDILRLENPNINFNFDGINDGDSWLRLFETNSWNRRKPLAICIPMISTSKIICDQYAYYENDTLKIIVRRANTAKNGFLFDTSADIGEKVNLQKSQNHLFLGMFYRSKGLVNSIMTDFNLFCKQSPTKKTQG